MTEWTPIDSLREMKVISQGKILIIRTTDNPTTTVPLFCPLCSFPLQTIEDSIAFRKGGCCDKCILFCRGDISNVPISEWENYLSERNQSNKPSFMFK